MNNVTRLKRTTKNNLYQDVVEWVKTNKNIEDIEEINAFVNSLSTTEVIDIWLKWNGILGYTDKIMDLINVMTEDY